MLIFTEFADTARYSARHLDRSRHRQASAQVDSATKTESGRRHPALLALLQRIELAARVESEAHDEIRVLISTDVLSEGLNLQDASRMINYDIHWNPVRLMQRIGRVDRRMNPEVEERLVADHPEVAARRGKVELLELPAARRAQRDSHALHQGHPEDAAHLEDARHRGQEAAHS